ncbi:MAG: hypothetical protein SNJ59_16005 [Aggregatilineales bacterium]
MSRLIASIVRAGGIALLCLPAWMPLSGQSAAADETVSDLRPVEVTLSRELDIYEQEVIVARGRLSNASDVAYQDVSLTAIVLNAEAVPVGEGIGFLVDACGAGLLPGFALQPNHSQPFAVLLELYEPDARIDHVEISAQGTPVEPLPPMGTGLAAGIHQISDEEIVEVSWQDDDSLLFAAGCGRDLFVNWRWHRHDRTAAETVPVDHPRADAVNDILRERLRLTDPLIFANSMLRFAPSGWRLVYQDAINQVYTAAFDGTLQRLLYTGLNNRSLQNIYWLSDDRFIAYYFGALGDPVLYFTADAEGRYISPPLDLNRESVSLPGASLDGRRVILGGTYDDVTGYFLNVLTYPYFELMFTGEVPGNNWPAPIPIVNPADDRVVRIYVARPVEGTPMLQCFNRDEGVLYDLSTLPLALTESDHAQWWISPDGRTLALAASGVWGGLWLIDLPALPRCEASSQAE